MIKCWNDKIPMMSSDKVASDKMLSEMMKCRTVMKRSSDEDCKYQWWVAVMNSDGNAKWWKEQWWAVMKQSDEVTVKQHNTWT
jgi:hypothetical protein